ncbi:MAG TPA: PPOX class F420-dependent oxidoreductase [Acidimicrobiales bacterium]|nr:PPOX class F420-dependent oxidoreductase [Acidimicrobiales bacterium]
MEIEQAREFLRHNHRAVLHTRRKDGSPQLSPVSCGLDDSGRAVVSTREPAAKTRNVRRDPRVSLCVFGDGFFGPWVQVDGVAEVVSLPEAMDGLVAYYRGIAGEHPDWDDYRRAMTEERRVLLLVTIERAGPDYSG